MKLIVCNNYDEVSKAAAELVADQIKQNKNSVLGLATGSTPIGMYRVLAEMNRRGDIDFQTIRSFNLDEYYPIADDNPQSYHYFMNENLFSKINIDKANTHILNGLCEDTEKECADFEHLIEENGGIDLQILGIGQNGHIGFNEPNESLNSYTHLTDLTENTIEANARFFDRIEDVPTKALTMGIGTILKARKIVLLATGASKHHAVRELLNSSISTENPASMLKVHPDVTLICDKEAYAKERIGVDIGGTEIKFGVLDEDNKLICKKSIPTVADSVDTILSAIEQECRSLMQDHCVSSIGIGTPGTIRGGLVSTVNLPFCRTDLKKELEQRLNIPVSVSNDANCAALAENICGIGKKSESLLMISLGTGVGGGIVLNHKIYEGRGSAGEIGHICIDIHGKACPCGQKGCWEQYASAKALIDDAKDAALSAPSSRLYAMYHENGDRMDGVLFFRAIREGSETAKKVLDRYTDYLAAGIQGLIYVFDPDLIVLTGGISNAGALLLDPLKAKLASDIPIEISTLKSDAGVIGAALLD